MTIPTLGGYDDGDHIVRPMAPARGVVIRRPRGGGQLVRDQGSPAARPWQATGSMDVEALAVWAYRDQRVDQSSHAGMHTIEVEASGGLASRWSTDGCATLGQIAHMGCRVETHGVSILHCMHPAAEAVDHALQNVDGASLVKHYARQAGQPLGWSDDGKRYAPLMWLRPGEAHWENGDEGSRYCPIILIGSPDEVERARREYLRWWDALDQLAWMMSMRALGFTVLPSSMPREPWAEAA